MYIGRNIGDVCDIPFFLFNETQKRRRASRCDILCSLTRHKSGAEHRVAIFFVICRAAPDIRLRREWMKKGTEITGRVERVDFPNKGIVVTE
ncbi:MAG: hypothetical protein SOW50_01280, partial [Lachnospiraceae bacterium]|nr:hypothetical protein [Lachnospiraceae bacterium]